MPLVDEQVDTPTEVDVDAVDVADPVADTDTPDAAAVPEEPFLSVNDRTVYKTREDAVRGANEAASRIAQLSGWEKQAKQFGLSDPKDLIAVANELLELRKAKAEAEKSAAELKTKTATANDPKAKETEQVRAYLKANGFISKEDQDAALKELRDQIEEMKSQGSKSEEMRFQNQEAESRNEVSSWLTAAGIKDDSGTKLQVVGTLIKDWINSDDERVERWARGGISAKTLVKEGFDLSLKALEWKGAAATTAAVVPGKSTDASYAANKAKALAANKKLPVTGTGKDAAVKGAAPKKATGITSDLHNKAYELFKKMQA